MNRKLIAIGSSTGGPGHLQAILGALPSNFKATIVIAQHINAVFLDSIVESLNSFCRIPVYGGQNGLVLEEPSVVFARGAGINEVVSENGGYRLKILDQMSDDYSPSINKLFFSIAKLPSQSSIMAALLTGIGDDGARGLLELRCKGAHTIAESEKTSVVYGMPRAAFEIDAASEILDLDKIIDKIIEFGR